LLLRTLGSSLRRQSMTSGTVMVLKLRVLYGPGVGAPVTLQWPTGLLCVRHGEVRCGLGGLP
jgi:hypothetical protein